MRINEVEALVGITKKNIRFYEEKGLVCPRRNAENGYREYGQAELAELQRIKLLRKLGVPIEEIHRMQQGGQTLGDCIRRHLITLRREQENLNQAIRLCGLIEGRCESLQQLDAPAILQEVERLEQSGTTFSNQQRQDVRARYLAPVAISAVAVLLLAVLAWATAWAAFAGGASLPESLLALMAISLILLAIYGVGYTLYLRIREIAKGEAERAKKY